MPKTRLSVSTAHKARGDQQPTTSQQFFVDILDDHVDTHQKQRVQSQDDKDPYISSDDEVLLLLICLISQLSNHLHAPNESLGPTNEH